MKPSFLYCLIVSLILSFLIVGCNKNDSNKKQTSVPIVETIVVTNVTQKSAQSGGSITQDGGAAITNRGVCWSTSINPTTSDLKTSDSLGTGNFISKILGLQPNTQYHLRAYASNSAGTAYGQDIIFATTQLQVPTITTTIASNITDSSLATGGTITSDNGAQVISRGVCWSISPNPTISLNTKTNDGTGPGSFASVIKGLSAGTTYYVRSYATNSIGTGYGNQISVTSSARIPTITTIGITNIGLNSAMSGGNISHDGGANVTSRGICWGTNHNPTIALSTRTLEGSGSGTFPSSITGLIPGTTYYVRAYATNSVGTAYGDELSFSTTASPPVVTTNVNVSDITRTSAVIGGSVINEGSFPVTARGLCWSTSPNPIIADNKTIEGTGIGNYTSTLTGLSPDTYYYVRAYATNSSGTSYGSTVNFRTVKFEIGQSYGGGIIFKTDGFYHGLIAANTDINSQPWSRFSSPPHVATDLDNGAKNTDNIIAAEGLQNGSYAAHACKTYNGNGYTDWFLPSAIQLYNMYEQRTILGMAIDMYWSSSECFNYLNAYPLNTNNGREDCYSKNSYLRIRPIRAF